MTRRDRPEMPGGDDGHGRQPRRRRLGGWRRQRRPIAVVEAPGPVIVDGTAVITVQAADFVCCSYKGCGTLRPLADAVEHRPCAGCGRV